MRILTQILSAILSLLPLAQAAPPIAEYDLTRIARLCDGYPQIPLTTPAGLCVGLFADKSLGFKMPRYATQLANGDVLISDMGGWAFNRGTIWALIERVNANGERKVEAVDLFVNKKLTMPNGLAVDPKGRVYVGTPQGIFRFQPLKANGKDLIINPVLEPVVNDFANSIYRKQEYGSANNYNTMAANVKNKHPLINFVFNIDFTELYVNIGAPSDNCSQGLVTLSKDGLCAQTEGQDAGALIRKYQLDADQKVMSGEIFARGLRNSMALALHGGSGYLLQGENSRDFKEAERPDEEINLVQKNHHYGWPYCYGEGQVAEEFRSIISRADCLGETQKFASPVILMPPHAAPLGMIYYQSARLPQLQNKLLVSWHGYRDVGHKVVAYDIDDSGLPTSTLAEEIVSDWEALAHLNPQGAPVGLFELSDGSVLIVDDKNKNVLRLSSGDAVNKRALIDPQQENYNFAPEAIASAGRLQTQFLANKCAACHSQFQNPNSTEMLKDLLRSGLIVPKDPQASRLYQKLEKRQMPPTREPDLFYTQILAELKFLIEKL